MVGGGFGGSIIALVQRGQGRELAARTLERYRGAGRFVGVVP
jgi:galactokinase